MRKVTWTAHLNHAYADGNGVTVSLHLDEGNRGADLVLTPERAESLARDLLLLAEGARKNHGVGAA